MPKTPAQNETARSNPFIKKGISKNLLTPCRQVGLSRKRKTPASSGSHSSQIPKVDNSSDNLETTPVSSNVSSIHEVEANKSNIKSMSTFKQKTDKKKTKVSKRLITGSDVKEPAQSPVLEDINQIDSRTSSDEKLGCMRLGDESIIKTKSESVTSKVKNKKKRWLDSDEDDFTVNDKKTEKFSCPSKTAKKISCLDEDESNATKESVMEIPENLTVTDSVIIATNDIKLENELSKRERKPVTKKERQMKNNTEEDSMTIKPQVVLLDKINKDGAEPQKTKKMKRSLSLKKSSEEDSEKYSQTKYFRLKECAVSLSPLRNSNIHSEISLNDIQDLEEKIKEKQKTVDNLRQAEIYKKKHNVQELQELTFQWKSGCISALNDLLPQLQTHATIDMATLLINLRVPGNLISLSPNGELS